MGYAIIIIDSRGRRLLTDASGEVTLYKTEGEAQAWADRFAACPGVTVVGVHWLD